MANRWLLADKMHVLLKSINISKSYETFNQLSKMQQEKLQMKNETKTHCKSSN